MSLTAVKPSAAHDDALIPVALVEAALTEAMTGMGHLAQSCTWEHPDGSAVTTSCALMVATTDSLAEWEAHQATHAPVWHDLPPDRGLRLADLLSALPVPDQNGVAPKTAVADSILGVMCQRSSGFVLSRLINTIERHERAYDALHPQVLDTPEPGRYLLRCTVCGEEFTAGRAYARTCSERCRKALQRQLARSRQQDRSQDSQVGARR